MADNSGGGTQPATGAFEVTPNDSDVLAQTTRALWVGATGTVRVRTLLGQVVSLVGVPTGTLLPVRCDRVYSTGTTASSIVGFY